MRGGPLDGPLSGRPTFPGGRLWQVAAPWVDCRLVRRGVAMIGEWRARRAAGVVEAGGVIAYPTEAVWGLGCNPWDGEAVMRLLALKDRPVEKGLILVADDIEQFDFLLHDLPEAWQTRLAGSWPGPYTWLVPHQGRLPAWISGAHDTVALRVTDHPLVCRLCALVGPLVSTSANPAGRPAARSALRVRQYFGDTLDAIDGRPLAGRPNTSQIRDLRTGDLVRPS